MKSFVQFGITLALSALIGARGVQPGWAQTATVNIDTVALTGMPAPGTNTTFFNASRVSLNNNGQAAFIGFLTQADPIAFSTWSLWTGDPNTRTKVTRSGEPAPGTTDGAVFLNFAAPLFNESGEVAFTAQLTKAPNDGTLTTNNDRGLWAGTQGNLRLIARKGDPAPGVEGSGAIFLNHSLPSSTPFNPTLNRYGQVAFSSALSFGSSGGSGVWIGDSYAHLTHISHTGETTPVGGTFFGFGPPSVNDSGELTFHATFSTGSGLWKWDGSTLGVVVRTGVTNPADGGPGGGLMFSGFTEIPALNGSGAVTFTARLNDNRKGIWVKNGGILTRVVLTGDAAPGATGATFSAFGSGSVGSFSPVINGVGEVTFFADLSDGSTGIWRWRSNTLTQVARTGVTDPADGGPGGGVTFTAFDGKSFLNPFISGPVLSRNGTVTFKATLSDGRQGIWIWDGTGLILIARTGDPLTVAPGDSHPIASLELEQFSGNEDGRYSGANDNLEVAFRAVFAPTSPFSAGIFLARVNRQPIANAGSDQTINEGNLVALDGSGSKDLDDDALAYSWEQLAGTNVTLSGSNSPTPTFTAPAVPAGGEVLTFRLTVSDGELDHIDTVDITVKNVNHVPVALAGEDQTVQEVSTISLDGSASYDPDDETLTFSWAQTAGSLVVLSNANVAKPTFTAPLVGPAGETLTFQLTVSDGIDSATDTVSVFVENVNHTPTADAGDDQTSDEGSSVTLDGTASSDPDGDTLTYTWIQLAGPEVSLSNPHSPTPTFTAPLIGPGGATLVFQLVVSDDGLLFSDPDTVTISVLDTNDPPACGLAQASPDLLWPPNHKLMTIGIMGVTDSNNDTISITVTRVTQDEPVNGLGDGDTSPDAVLQGNGVLLRTERAGNGNGRVYRVSFAADDGQSGSCTGSVTICVPQNSKATCIDDGQQYNSLQP
ncbi:MAG TPA: choice-of-anchor tandem repeat NxxGxxAF-containing protein [Candidatus Binatia bacterium]|jgi:hypothetical protein|nr:choice-of-anchor tandem repeat NxxGxxAF-containing protein [Candidatus Binatia bacterium]